MSSIIRIDPNGDVAECAGTSVLEFANNEFNGMVDVIMLLGFPGHMFVGCVHDFGMVNGMPMNMKASALYGRSPIFGPMYVSYDSDEETGRNDVELPRALIASLTPGAR